ncbi:MAG TPA: hypothetical protein VK024_05180, partial [Actinomycetaceae bacterium]|nr:hypothetical protein [Actinomycetaceae bacterium]
MRNIKKRARAVIALFAALGLALVIPAPSFADEEADYSSLIFDADAAYQGRFTDSGITFDTYQVTYVADPIAAFPDHFKLNIKVPVSYNDVVFDPAAVASGPILATNPWGGDNGAPVPDVDTLAGG